MKRLAISAVALLLLCSFSAWAQSSRDALARIKSAKAINVGYAPDSPPFSFTDSDKKPAGFSIELCNRVIAAIGRAVDEPNLQVNWVAGSVAERLQGIRAGKLDLECANTTRTLARMKDVDFSGLIFVDTGGFLVRTNSALGRFTDLNGKKIAVIKGTTTEQRLMDALKMRLVNAEVVAVLDGNDGLMRVETGGADAYASDKVKLIGLAWQSKSPEKLAMMQEDLSYEPYAFALPRGDADMRWQVDRALAQVYASGEIERIFDRWLGKLGKPTGLGAAVYILNIIPE